MNMIKECFFTCMFLIYLSSISAQVISQEIINNEECVNESFSLNQMLPSQLSIMPIWEEDFSNGFPQGWSTHSVNTQGGVATCPWNWTLDGTWGYWNGNNGASPSNELNSTTAVNGFLISDIDSANHYSYGQPSGNTYQYIESFFTTSAIDLSLHPAVSLEFEHLYRYNNLGNLSFNPPTVYVSTDSISWTPYLVNNGTANNTQSSNPQNQLINITSVAGGQSTVFLRFGWTARCYYWMIDDIRLIETPPNLVTMEDEVIGGFWIDYMNYSGNGFNAIVGLDYSVTPLSQIQNHPYAIEALFKNEGGLSQTVNLAYDVTGTASFNGSSTGQVLNPGDALFLGASFSPTMTGPYTIEIWGEADSVGAGVTTTLTNMATRDIEVTNYIYGKDLGDSNPGSYILGGIEDQNHITTRYEMYADEELYALRAFVADNSDVGAELKAIIYELDSTANNGVRLVAESDNYTISAQDLGNWIDIPFLNSISLFNGYAYEFGIVGFNHPSLESYIGIAGTSLYNGEHSLFDELGLSAQSAGTPTWYYITSTPMVRMNFDPSLIASASEIKDDVFNVYPNPSNGKFTLSLDKKGKYDVYITNMLGQNIFSGCISELNTVIDLSSFDKGVYTIELKAEKRTYTQKFIND